MAHNLEHQSVVTAEGHLVDSQILNTVFDRVIERGGPSRCCSSIWTGQIRRFPASRCASGRPTAGELTRLVEDLIPVGCHSIEERDALIRETGRDGCVPPDFYATTNLRTHVRSNGRWVPVERQRMDAVIVVEEGRARCRKLRDARAGDQVVFGLAGLRVTPAFRDRDRAAFAS